MVRLPLFHPPIQPLDPFVEAENRAMEQERVIKKLLVDNQQTLRVLEFDGVARERHWRDMKRRGEQTWASSRCISMRASMRLPDHPSIPSPSDILREIHDAALSAEARLQLQLKNIRYTSSPPNHLPHRSTSFGSMASTGGPGLPIPPTDALEAKSISFAEGTSPGLEAPPPSAPSASSNPEESHSHSGTRRPPPPRTSYHFLTREQKQKALRGTVRTR